MVNQDLLNMSDLGVMDVYGSICVDVSHTAGKYYKNYTMQDDLHNCTFHSDTETLWE